MATQMTTNNKKALEGAPPWCFLIACYCFGGTGVKMAMDTGRQITSGLSHFYPTFTPLFTPLFTRFSLDREGTYRTAAGVAYAKNIGDTAQKTNTDGTDKTPADATKKKEIITHGHRFGKRNGAYGMGKPFVHRKPTYKPCPQSPFPSSPFMV